MDTANFLQINIGKNINAIEDINLDNIYNINNNANKIFEKNTEIPRKIAKTLNMKLANSQKRIYKSTIYGVNYNTLKNLNNFDIDKNFTGLYYFYEAHRNNTFYYSEAYQLTLVGKTVNNINNNYFEYSYFNKKQLNIDNFPLINNLDYTSDIMECIEYIYNNIKLIQTNIGDKSYLSFEVSGNIKNELDNIMKIYDNIKQYLI